MTPFFPVFELVDRYVIAMLKYNKTQSNQPELDFYREQLNAYDLTDINTELEQLYTIHSNIWALESELKSGLEDQVPLEEIGRRAIAIRNWNNQRIALKNTMAAKLGQGHVVEVKRDHLSE